MSRPNGMPRRPARTAGLGAADEPRRGDGRAFYMGTIDIGGGERLRFTALVALRKSPVLAIAKLSPEGDRLWNLHVPAQVLPALVRTVAAAVATIGEQGRGVPCDALTYEDEDGDAPDAPDAPRFGGGWVPRW